ncbi:hypothetical protein [Cellulosimicrobium sp. BE325]|uniref:hypothetical protein n=1 Tax=Cellulosimicrobium sp. 4261 TaxID=3156458 RepID=UPI001AE95E89
MPDDIAGVFNAIAWEEIERLGARGLPGVRRPVTVRPGPRRVVVELGHVRDALLGLSEDDLRDLVVVELDRERPTLRPAREAFAEAVTVALTPDGEGRTWFYDEHVPEENVRAAELVIEAFTSSQRQDSRTGRGAENAVTDPGRTTGRESRSATARGAARRGT